MPPKSGNKNFRFQVTKTELVDVAGPLEHIDIQQFFDAFHPKTDPEAKQTLADFLTGKCYQIFFNPDRP